MNRLSRCAIAGRLVSAAFLAAAKSAVGKSRAALRPQYRQRESYGKAGAWLANEGNIQQYVTSMDPDECKSAIKDSGEVVSEKLVITKGPGIAGKLVIKALPSVGGFVAGVAGVSGFLSGR